MLWYHAFDRCFKSRYHFPMSFRCVEGFSNLCFPSVFLSVSVYLSIDIWWVSDELRWMSEACFSMLLFASSWGLPPEDEISSCLLTIASDLSTHLDWPALNKLTHATILVAAIQQLHYHQYHHSATLVHPFAHSFIHSFIHAGTTLDIRIDTCANACVHMNIVYK